MEWTLLLTIRSTLEEMQENQANQTGITNGW